VSLTKLTALGCPEACVGCVSHHITSRCSTLRVLSRSALPLSYADTCSARTRRRQRHGAYPFIPHAASCMVAG